MQCFIGKLLTGNLLRLQDSSKGDSDNPSQAGQYNTLYCTSSGGNRLAEHRRSPGFHLHNKLPCLNTKVGRWYRPRLFQRSCSFYRYNRHWVHCWEFTGRKKKLNQALSRMGLSWRVLQYSSGQLWHHYREEGHLLITFIPVWLIEADDQKKNKKTLFSSLHLVDSALQFQLLLWASAVV